MTRSRRSTCPARRGVGMMMVLGVVATASILSWAMLSASATRSQMSLNAADSVEANNLAESGVSYALYYLRYPARSPVPLTAGAFGDAHYPGQTGLRLWSDANGLVDIVVTNTARETFTIRSSAVVAGMRQTVEADAKLVMEGYRITSASGINGAFVIPNSMSIDGPVIAKGAITGATSQISNSPTPTPAGVDVVPVAGEVALLIETGEPASGADATATDRTYKVGSNTYVAERAPATITGSLMTARLARNPYNVWYSDGNVAMSNASFNGVLVMRNATGVLTVSGANTLTGSGGMPALVAANRVDMASSLLSPAKLTVNGVAWIGNKIRGTGTALTAGLLKVDGSLLFGGGEMKIESFNYPIQVTYKPAAAGVRELSTVRTIGGINVTRWQNVE